MSVQISGNSSSTCVKINKKRAFHYRRIAQQVLGITPYASHPNLPTREMAKAIIRSMRGLSDYQIEHKYTRNLALLVSSHIHPQVLYPCRNTLLCVSTLHLHVCRENLWGRVLLPLRGGNFINSSKLIHQKVFLLTRSGKMSWLRMPQCGKLNHYIVVTRYIFKWLPPPTPPLSLTLTNIQHAQCNWCWEYWWSQL